MSEQLSPETVLHAVTLVEELLNFALTNWPVQNLGTLPPAPPPMQSTAILMMQRLEKCKAELSPELIGYPLEVVDTWRRMREALNSVFDLLVDHRVLSGSRAKTGHAGFSNETLTGPNVMPDVSDPRNWKLASAPTIPRANYDAMEWGVRQLRRLLAGEESWVSAGCVGSQVTTHFMPMEVETDIEPSNGMQYGFTTTQAACVKVLWEASEQGNPELHQLTILEAAGTSAGDNSRLVDVFRRWNKQRHKHEYHPAWGTMITKGKTRGTYRLAPGEGTHSNDFRSVNWLPAP